MRIVRGKLLSGRVVEPQFPKVEFTVSYFGPVIGTHPGEGAMALGWIKKESREP